MNTIEQLQIEWKDIAKKIKAYDKKYAHGKPLISDTSYDALKARLKDIEDIIGKQKNSPLDNIGSVEEETLDHEHPMLSLDHGYGEESISEFYKKIRNALKIDHDPEMILEHKIDGIATSIRYENNTLHLVLTRGDGFKGINITEYSKYISGIPRSLSINNLEIRGEIYMRFDDFQKTSGFKNPRNAVAGILRNKQLDFIAAHKLYFIAHGFVGNDNFSTYSEAIDLIQNNGFMTSKHYISKSKQESIDIFHSINRDNIEYPIDGVVLKVNDLETCEKLGNHSTAPRYAFAAKFPPKNSQTEIIDIQMQVGKFGIITPVAIVKPIEIDGVTINKVSLHNLQELKNKNYNIGDEIILARAGDVIPYVLQKLNSNNLPYHLPKTCPSCNEQLIWDSVSLKCTNGWNCREQAILRIEHFVSRKAFNINGLGSKNIEKLYNTEILRKPDDIFKLSDLAKQNDMTTKNLLGSKVMYNLYHQIEKNRTIELGKFIYALCIPNVGYRNAAVIAKHCETFNKFIELFSSNDIQIKTIGPVIVESIKQFIANEIWIHNLQKSIIII